MRAKAVFLDLYGSILWRKEKVEGVTEEQRLMPGAADALRLLAQEGYLLFIVSNQALINRGDISREAFEEIQKNLEKKLVRKGVSVEGSYYCPHTPEEGCECRKPNIGMLGQAAKEFEIDFSQSWVVGDKTSDILAGQRARCKTILLEVGYAGTDNEYEVEPNYRAKNLYAAVVDIILPLTSLPESLAQRAKKQKK